MCAGHVEASTSVRTQVKRVTKRVTWRGFDRRVREVGDRAGGLRQGGSECYLVPPGEVEVAARWWLTIDVVREACCVLSVCVDDGPERASARLQEEDRTTVVQLYRGRPKYDAVERTCVRYGPSDPCCTNHPRRDDQRTRPIPSTIMVRARWRAQTKPTFGRPLPRSLQLFQCRCPSFCCGAVMHL